VLVVPVAEASNSAPRGVMRATVTGEITEVDPQWIVVEQIACVIPPRLAPSVSPFVIGDPVRLSCLGGRLVRVRYAPEVAPNQTDSPGTRSAPPTAPTSSCGLSCATVVAYSVGMIFHGGGPTGDTSTATGTITDISDGSVTAGGLTCSFASSFDEVIDQAARGGDTVTLTCTGGVFIGMKSVGSASR
jgi:hypothetical protein